MDGFKRPQRQSERQIPAPTPVKQEPTPTRQTEVAPQPTKTAKDKKVDAIFEDIVQKRSKWRIIWLILLGLLVAVVAGVWFWYQTMLSPVDTNNKTVQSVVVKKGMTADQIAASLKEAGLIRSVAAFDIYTRLDGTRSSMQAGTCKFTPAESVEQIVDKLVAGCTDFKVVTFYPGGALVDSKAKPAGHDVTSALKNAGYSDAEIKAALTKQYTGPLFADKPAGTSLEGYVYGETYYVATSATAEEVLQQTFDEMYKQINDNGLAIAFKKHGLNLYEALTLASIVQREMGCQTHTQACYEDQRKIAQVFLKRLAEGIPLGSDVTFVYGADLKGVTPTVDVDSPYNTRIHAGLTPTPIASPGIGALKAVANPADTDYLFFVSGDDGKNYFTRSQAEHEQAIRDHCQVNCRIF